MQTIIHALPAPTRWTDYHLACQDAQAVQDELARTDVRDDRWDAVFAAWRVYVAKADAAFDAAYRGTR